MRHFSFLIWSPHFLGYQFPSPRHLVVLQDPGIANSAMSSLEAHDHYPTYDRRFYGISLFLAITRREFGPAPDSAIGLFAFTCRLRTSRSSSEWLSTTSSHPLPHVPHGWGPIWWAHYFKWILPSWPYGVVNIIALRRALQQLVNCFQWSNIAWSTTGIHHAS